MHIRFLEDILFLIIKRQHEKQLEELRLQRNSYENQIYSTNNQLEELKNQMQWDQHALEAWLEESARRDEGTVTVEFKYPCYLRYIQSFDNF